ncbi:UNVERIFIED_CONTAM: hypothetical protein NY603_27555, partial [Bacteroidetes bacterium 56_B9]
RRRTVYRKTAQDPFPLFLDRPQLKPSSIAVAAALIGYESKQQRSTTNPTCRAKAKSFPSKLSPRHAVCQLHD